MVASAICFCQAAPAGPYEPAPAYGASTYAVPALPPFGARNQHWIDQWYLCSVISSSGKSFLRFTSEFTFNLTICDRGLWLIRTTPVINQEWILRSIYRCFPPWSGHNIWKSSRLVNRQTRESQLRLMKSCPCLWVLYFCQNTMYVRGNWGLRYWFVSALLVTVHSSWACHVNVERIVTRFLFFFEQRRSTRNTATATAATARTTRPNTSPPSGDNIRLVASISKMRVKLTLVCRVPDTNRLRAARTASTLPTLTKSMVNTVIVIFDNSSSPTRTKFPITI